MLVSRQFAREYELASFYTGKPCRNGHLSERYTVGGHCIACLNAAKAAWKARLGAEGVRDLQKEYDARFAAKNPEKKRANSRAAVRLMREKDPGLYRAAQQQWRKENPDKVAAMRKRSLEKLRAENLELLRLRQMASRSAARAKSGGVVSPEGFSAIVRRIWAKGCVCVVCCSTENLELDHIVPLAHGGTNDESNLQLLCMPCNRSKGTLDFAVWKQRRSEGVINT